MSRVIKISATLAFLLLATPKGASATPEFAKQWASSCASCHVGAPTGLDEEGIAFKLAGYSLDVEAKNPRPKLFFSFLTDLLTLSEEESLETPESVELFSLFRLDRQGRVKVFASGELTDTGAGLELELVHGHLQVNPLSESERLSLRFGRIEPVTRLWNTDMRRVFETSLWGGIDTATGELSAGGGGHGGGLSGRPGVLPESGWGGDVSSVFGRNLLVAGGFAGDTGYGGVFWKRGGRGFDNTTVSSSFRYGDLSAEEQVTFNAQQTKLARKWERSVIFGLSAYTGSGSWDALGGAAAEGEDHDELMPAPVTGTSRFVGEISTRWDRYGLYVVGVYGVNSYARGESGASEPRSELELFGGKSNDFFALAVEGSARLKVSRRLTGRIALRYEELEPENNREERFRRAVANLTIPVRLMRPALWPYLELSQILVSNDLEIRAGLKLAY